MNNSYFHQETERLTFRKLTETDIEKWLAFFVNNGSLRFMGIDLTKSHEHLADEWIRTQFIRYKKNSLGHLAVERKDDGTFIGLCGILPRILNDKTEYEIAYSLIPKFWKNGYGTEMAQQLKKYGQEHIKAANRFVSIIHVENTASIHVAKKNGMKVLFSVDNYLGMEVDVFGIDV